MKKIMSLSRTSIIVSIFTIGILGVLFGSSMYSILYNYLHWNAANITVCMIAFIIFLYVMWLPFLVEGNELKAGEDCISYLPKYPFKKKFAILFYVLVKNNVEPFLRHIMLFDIQTVTFTFTRHWGVWGYSRYSLLLKLKLEHETLTLYINSMDNGAFLPSGNSGMLPAMHAKTHYDILNMVQYVTSQGASLSDPYHLCEALKDETVVLYDYLETIHKKIIF